METWRVGVHFCDVWRCKFRWLPPAPDAQLLLRHLGLYSSIVLLKYSMKRLVIGSTFAAAAVSISTASAQSHLIVVVHEVRMLALQLDHQQPGDPLLLLGCHQIAVRIPVLSFSTHVRRLYEDATPWT